MSDFSKPFADNVPNDRRRPTDEEQALGFPCGPLDVKLFNGLFHALQNEMQTLAAAAGVEGSDADHNLLRDAVLALISAATGGGDTAQFVLYEQARSRLPIHFEVLSADGKINVTSPAAGTVRVPGGVSFVHRGIFQGTTVQTDFPTTASTMYHVRWQKAVGGFALKRLTDANYNPLGLDETDAVHDGKYDDALIARVLTNASNIATITPLVNRPRLANTSVVNGANLRSAGANMAAADFEKTLDWSRTPDMKAISMFSVRTEFEDQDRDVYPYGWTGGNGVPEYPATRYRSRFTVMRDGSTAIAMNMAFGA